MSDSTGPAAVESPEATPPARGNGEPLVRAQNVWKIFGAKADKLPDGVAKLLELRERLSAEHARCANDLAYARALCRGNEDMRAVWLHKVERAPYAEIGRILGCSAMTARRRVAAGERMVYATMPEEWRRYAIPNAMPQ